MYKAELIEALRQVFADAQHSRMTRAEILQVARSLLGVEDEQQHDGDQGQPAEQDELRPKASHRRPPK